MSDSAEKTYPTCNLSFENKTPTDMLIGIEPLGLYYDVSPSKLIEITYIPYNDYKQIIYVEKDNTIVIDTNSADVIVYLDGKLVYP